MSWRAEQDKNLKQYALDGIFSLLQNDVSAPLLFRGRILTARVWSQELLSKESLDGEVSQLMLGLSQYGTTAAIKKQAGAVVVRLAEKASYKPAAFVSPASELSTISEKAKLKSAS